MDDRGSHVRCAGPPFRNYQSLLSVVRGEAYLSTQVVHREPLSTTRYELLARADGILTCLSPLLERLEHAALRQDRHPPLIAKPLTFLTLLLRNVISIMLKCIILESKALSHEVDCSDCLRLAKQSTVAFGAIHTSREATRLPHQRTGLCRYTCTPPAARNHVLVSPIITLVSVSTTCVACRASASL